MAITDISSYYMIGVFTCAVAVVLILQVIQRLYFHPLAKYPGPLLAKCTAWYAAYHAYIGDIHEDVQRCHERYGDFVRYRPNGLLVNNVEGLKDIYMSPSNTQKSRGYIGIRAGEPEISILNALNREEHAPRRKLLSRAFSTAALKKFEPVIYKTAKVFGDVLIGQKAAAEGTRSGSNTINVGHMSERFTFDVMSTVVFYSPQNLMTDPRPQPIFEFISSATKMAGIEMSQPRLVDYRKLRCAIARETTKKGDNMRKMIGELVVNRVALREKEDVEDIFGDLLGHGVGKDGPELSEQELLADAIVMVVAGTDTSSVAISAFFFYLARNPKAYNRLASEIRSTFSSLEEITPGPKLTSCTYLVACIDEAMRLAPPVPAPLWREMRMQEKIAGNVLPKGTDVGTSCYSIHRNPAYFPNPNEFVPERWLPEDPEDEQFKLAKRAFAPFSLGSRGCLGKNIAYIELTTALAQVMFRSDFKSAEGPQGKVGETLVGEEKIVNFKIKGHFTSHKEGPYIEFVPRKLPGEDARVLLEN